MIAVTGHLNLAGNGAPSVGWAGRPPFCGGNHHAVTDLSRGMAWTARAERIEELLSFWKHLVVISQGRISAGVYVFYRAMQLCRQLRSPAQSSGND